MATIETPIIRITPTPLRWARIIPILILHAATLYVLSITMTNVAFGLHDYCQQNDIEMPARTMNVVWLSEQCYKFALPIFGALIIADCLTMLALTSWKRTKHFPLSAISQIFIFLALVVAVYIIAWMSNPIIWQLN